MTRHYLSALGTLSVLAAFLIPPLDACAKPRGNAVRFEDVQRQVTLNTAPSSSSQDQLPGTVIGSDVRFVAEGVLATGYDSNIDYRVSEEDGGAYGLADLAAGLIVGPANERTTAVVRGSFGYHDIDSRPERWDAGSLFDHYRIIAPDVSLNAGAFFLHDDIDVDANERAAGYSELSYSGTDRSAFLRGRIMHTHYLADRFQDLSTQQLFHRDETFDHIRAEQSAGLMLLKNQRLAPYAEIGYAHLNYNNELNPSIFSRDADEMWAIGGVRVTFTERLHIDLGARHNQRWIDDPTISSHNSVFFDGKLVWTPHDGMYIEANIDRVFLEPIDDGSLLTDSTTYSLLAITDLDARTKLKVEVGHIEEDQVGTPDIYQMYYGEGRLTYAVNANTDVFGSLIGYQSRNEANDLEAHRFDVMVGLRITN